MLQELQLETELEMSTYVTVAKTVVEAVKMSKKVARTIDNYVSCELAKV